MSHSTLNLQKSGLMLRAKFQEKFNKTHHSQAPRFSTNLSATLDFTLMIQRKSGNQFLEKANKETFTKVDWTPQITDQTSPVNCQVHRVSDHISLTWGVWNRLPSAVSSKFWSLQNLEFCYPLIRMFLPPPQNLEQQAANQFPKNLKKQTTEMASSKLDVK